MHRKYLFAIPITVAFLLIAVVVFAQDGDTLQTATQSGPDSANTAVSTAFNYQGSLMQGGQTADGAYEFEFRLFDAVENGNQVGDPIEETLQVNQGLFATDLDFGSPPWDGSAYYLQIEVRNQGSTDPYTVLTPRQPLSVVPYALALPGLRTEQNEFSPKVIGGYAGNAVAGDVKGAVIAGGGEDSAANSVIADFGAIGGGSDNQASGAHATVGGGNKNRASIRGATVGGGYENTASNLAAIVGGGEKNLANSAYATVGGGGFNQASGAAATVGGGQENRANSKYATVGGGNNNLADGEYATVGGGGFNQASGLYATVGGGDANVATGSLAIVGGGDANVATDNWAIVGGGHNNKATGHYAIVDGGQLNTASGKLSAVGGGSVNFATGLLSTVGGGFGNAANDEGATVGGGRNNSANDEGATVGGGQGNRVSADFGVIAGGSYSDIEDFDTRNRVTDEYGVIGGGGNNQAGNANDDLADASFTTVGGGRNNTASGSSATVGGGNGNTASRGASTVGGGRNNTASDEYSTVGGGSNNSASEWYATVGGGYGNSASEWYATVPGGFGNSALGRSSFAAGYNAESKHDGSFVWSSDSAAFSSTGENQFLIDADGGVGIGTNAPATQLHVVAARNGAANMTEHVVAIENNSFLNSSGPDVLALKVTNLKNPGASTNYITFTDENGGVGAVEGNGSGGVVYKTGGADFAEYLPLADPSVTLEPGAIVGLARGRISLHTAGAEQLFVVSSAAGFVGNADGDEQPGGTVLVALMGQVTVQVQGEVHAGDAILASGLNDGLGVAVPAADLSAEQVGQIVGQALEDSDEGSVLILVGLPREAIWQVLLQARDDQLAEMETRLAQLEQLVLAGDSQ